MQKQMHCDINRAQISDLEAIRAQWGISRAHLCRQAGLNEATYGRWMRWLHGQRGSRPNPNNVERVRAALKRLTDS